MNKWFSKQVLDWHQHHGRHDLPWQSTGDPYHVWLSECMLQQTQVQTVIPYFIRFIQQLPTVRALADAPQTTVMNLWAGLGYYRRAKYLHQAAQVMRDHHQATVPDKIDALMALPGIGRSTAGAILSLGFNQPYAILDGNVKRVLCRFFAVKGWPEAPVVQKQLWGLANALLPNKGYRDYTQGMMDLGATCCLKTNPDCHRCPLASQCQAKQHKLIQDLPEKKPRKTVPKKTITFVLPYTEAGKVYLVKRPDQGLWSNLWALPEITTSPQPALHQGTKTHSLAPFKHQLTHFSLTIKADCYLIPASSPLVNPPSDQEGDWFDLTTIQTQLGLPVPIKKLIEQWTCIATSFMPE